MPRPLPLALDPAARLEGIASTRAAFRAAVCDPLNTVLRTARGLDHAAMVFALPMEAAAAGFTLTICQGETGWRVELQRPIDDTAVFDVSAEARSLTAALFQLSDRGLIALDQLDCQARSNARRPVKGMAAA